jgi:hypothetical protein
MLGLQISSWVLCLSPLILMGLLGFIVWRSRQSPILSIVSIILWGLLGICVLTLVGLYPAFEHIGYEIKVLQAQNAVETQCGIGRFDENALHFDDSATTIWYESDDVNCTRSRSDLSWTCSCQ